MTRVMTRGLALLAALALLGAVEARADTQDYLNYCRTGALRPCASIQITTVLNNGGTDVSIRVRNLGWYGGADRGPLSLYQIEIQARDDGDYFGAVSDVSVTTEGNVDLRGTFTANDTWRVQSQSDELEIQTLNRPDDALDGFAGIYGCDATGVTGAYYQTCGDDAGWVVISFHTEHEWDIKDEFVLGMQFETADLGGDDIECETWQNCGPVDASTVPEPVTMLLLGSGLAGMGGVGLLNRRRRKGS